MKAFIQSVAGEPFNEECAAAKQGFEELGVECVPFSTNEELEQAAREDVVVAGLLVTEHVLTLRGIEPPNINYPKELESFLGRKVWQCPIGDITEDALPLFVKPVKEKELGGIVAKTTSDLASFREKGPDYQVLCSEPVGFLSERRVFVRYGECVGTKLYKGGGGTRMHADLINNLIWEYRHGPAGYAFDVGSIDDGRLLIVEVNDGYALGCYGLDPVAYALLLSARWAELVGTKDPFENYDMWGNPYTPRERSEDEMRLQVIIDQMEGVTEKFYSVTLGCVLANGIEGELADYMGSTHPGFSDVWHWISERLSLEQHIAEDGEVFVFPSRSNVRFAISLTTGESSGNGGWRPYNDSTAFFTGWIDENVAPGKRQWLYSLLVEYAEKDAKENGKCKIFVLGTEDEDFPGNEPFLKRGYEIVPEKDEKELIKALGAYVTHGCILEKEL